AYGGAEKINGHFTGSRRPSETIELTVLRCWAAQYRKYPPARRAIADIGLRRADTRLLLNNRQFDPVPVRKAAGHLPHGDEDKRCAGRNGFRWESRRSR